MTIREKAAHKAWRTMRTPEWKLRNKALRAWETRRAMERTARALRAWETRRAA